MKRNLRPPLPDSSPNNNDIPEQRTRRPLQNQINNYVPPEQHEHQNEDQQDQEQEQEQERQKKIYGEETHKTSQRHKNKMQDYKINPRQIPRPNHNDEIYLNNSCNIIYETAIGSTTPYSSSYYSVKETENSSCRFIRSTMNNIPNNQTMLTSSCLMLGLICQPFAELPDHETPIPQVNANEGIFRCQKCLAYINSKFQITYSGTGKQVVICNICLTENEYDLNKAGMKADYFSTDTSIIPELTCPTIDFIPPKRFENDKDFKPHYLYMIDISTASNDIGLPSYLLNSIQSNLTSFHNAEETHIGFALYDPKTIFFFYIEHDEIRLAIMPDINDPFCPVSIKKLYLNAVTQRESIEKLLEKITLFIMERQEINKAIKSPSMPTGAAIKAGVDSLLENGGRVMIFSCSPCNHGFGSIPVNDPNNKQVNQSEKINDFIPKHEVFGKIAETAIEGRVVVDQFILFNVNYELGTFGMISNITGGHIEYYQNSKEVMLLNSTFEKMHYDITRIISRANYYDIRTMIRFSQGLDCYEILGPFTKKLGEAFQLSSCDPDYSYCYNLRLNEALKPQQKMHIQIAVLYINNFNQKYLRLFNMTYEATDEVAKVYNTSDVNATAKMIIMKEISLLWRSEVEKVRKNLEDRIISSFQFYRAKEKSTSNPGQLILPIGLRYLPLYLNSFIKKKILTTKGTVLNYIVYLMHKLMRDPLPNVIKFLYPKFYRIDDVQNDQITKFQAERAIIIENVGLMNERFNMIQKPYLLFLSKDNIDFDNAYIIDDGRFISLYIFEHLKPSFYEDLFGYSTWRECKENNVTTLNEENMSDLNVRVLNIVGQLRKENGGFIQPVRIFFLSEHSFNNPELMNCLIEDQLNEETNYSDFLCMLHTSIQQRMNY